MIGWAASLPGIHDRVAVYLKADALNSGVVLTSMRAELAHIMGQVKYDVVWWNQSQGDTYTDAPLVVVQLTGTCKPSTVSSPDTSAQIDGKPLASTQEVGQRILPFVWLDCEMLSAFLGTGEAGSANKRDQKYGKAMARLLAHELFHYLGQTHDHTTYGITQSGVTAAELLSSRFDFDHQASLELRKD